MSQFVVPSWNLRHQRQDQVDGGEGSRSFHVQNHPHPSYVVPMPTDHEVTELTWENGQISVHGMSNTIPPPAQTKPTYPSPCGRPADHTLESIVHQATCHHRHNHVSTMNMMQSQKAHEPSISNTAAVKAGQVQMLPLPSMVKKRVRSETESDQCGRYLSNSNRMHEFGTERSACASASATVCRDNNKDTTMMTWASFESPASLKTKTTDDDSDSHPGMEENRDEEQETKGGTDRNCSARRSRAAAVHNQSERRRRDRINQKMKALQKLVPNANKTDKASMLDEVIQYLKQLQAQVHMMSTRTIMAPQMMMHPLALQQQLQMTSLLARMGMSAAGVGGGMGLGMLDVNAMARTAATTPHSLQSLMNPSTPLPSTTPAFLPPHFAMPPMIPAASAAAKATTATAVSASNPFSYPYAAFLAQQTKENMDFYSKMAALYRQQQANQTRNNANLPNFNGGK